jgi:predicted nucleotide-binding protein
MAGMERFTQRARRVLSFAHQETERARNNHIDTEHLLIGLMREEGGVAGRVLRELGLSTERVREVVGRVTTASDDYDPSRVELSAKTQQVLEYAVDEARRFGHHYVGTEHILLGLVRADSTALEVLRRLGVNVDQIRKQTRRVLNESAASSRPGISRNLNQVLIVHGFDNETKETVAAYLENLGLTVASLNEQASRGTTFNEKFENDIGGAAFMVALLTPDNLVAPRADPQNTKFHASQNVIYELGFFHGKLGRNRVCALFKSDSRQDIELPSHYLGIVYIPLDDTGKWKTQLAKELKAAGLVVDLENEL